MDKVLRWSLQVLFYAAFAGVVGYLSFWPRYDYASADLAAVKLSISHATERVVPCVRLTPEEIAELPPNMRTQQSCERRRVPLVLELEVDGEVVLTHEAAPSGLWEDGAASVYERFELAPGPHTMTVRMRDSAREDAWNYIHTEDVVLQEGTYTSITFRAENGGFRIR